MSNDSSISVQVQTVNPEMASGWLAHNGTNRHLRKRWVEFWKRAMLDGEWRLSPDALAFDTEGRLINGQHRLRALVETDQRLPFIVLRNVPTDTFSVTDQGLKRSAGDMWELRGHANYNQLAAVISLLFRWRQHRLSRSTLYRPTPDQQHAIYMSNPGLLTRAAALASSKTFRIPCLWPSSVATLWFLTAEIDEVGADYFLDGLVNGVGLSQFSPPLTLRQLLSNYQIRRMKAPLDWQFAVYIRAWNAYRDGRELKVLRWSASDDMPLPK